MTATFKYKMYLTYLVSHKGEKMPELVQMGKISSRGQIAIPSDIRREMDLGDGTRILFLLEDKTLVIKKITPQTFAQITKPLKEQVKRAGLEEKNVPKIIQNFRKRKR